MGLPSRALGEAALWEDAWHAHVRHDSLRVLPPCRCIGTSWSATMIHRGDRARKLWQAAHQVAI